MKLEWFGLFPCKVMLDLYSLPEVAQLTAKHSACTVLTHVPVSTRKGVYLHPWQLDMSEEAKFGSPGKFPSNVGIRNHFASVVQRGYESEKEALEIKFPSNLHGSGLEIPMFSTGFIDGHTKATMVLAVFALLEHIVARHSFKHMSILQLDVVYTVYHQSLSITSLVIDNNN